MSYVLYIVGITPSSNPRRDLRELQDKGFGYAYATTYDGEPIIQLGSFTLRENAMVYRDELKVKGFEAFVKTRIMA